MGDPRLVLAASALAVAACGNPEWQRQAAEAQAAVASIDRARLDGALRVNGAPFPFATCLSGDVGGYRGVELESRDGSKLRLVQEVDGTGTVIRTGTGEAPVTIKACGTVAVERLPEGHDGLYAAQGIARLDCGAGGLHVEGSVSFRCGVRRPPELPSPPPAPPPTSASTDGEDRYKVDVDFRAARSGDSYRVHVPGVGECTTPCALRGLPGSWDLRVSGAASFERHIFVPAVGADVKLVRATPGNATTRTLGWTLGALSAASALTGYAWGNANVGSSPPPPAIDVAAPVALFVAGFAGLFYSAYLIDRGNGGGFDDAEVTPRR